MILSRLAARIFVCAALAAGAYAQSRSAASNTHLLATYSWGVTNIGDIAITPGFLSLLREVRPDMPLVVMTYQRANHPAYPTMQRYLSGYLPGVRTLAFPFPALAEASLTTGFRNHRRTKYRVSDVIIDRSQADPLGA